MEPEQLRPDRSSPQANRPLSRPERPDPPARDQPQPPRTSPTVPPGDTAPRVDRRYVLLAGVLAVAATAAERVFRPGGALPQPRGQDAGPEYRAATLAIQAAPTLLMPADLGSWSSCTGSATTRGLSELDLTLVVDNTGSMSSVIGDVKANIGRLIATLQSGGGRVRLGMVSYRDTGDEYVVRHLPLTEVGSASAILGFVASMQAHGGGDWPEKLDAALQFAADMDWRRDTQAAIVVIADAPAHPGDAATASAAVKSFVGRVPGGQVSVIDSGSGGDAFLRALPGTGRGQYVTYDGDILKSLYPSITACPSK